MRLVHASAHSGMEWYEEIDALTHVHTAERTESWALAMLTGGFFKKKKKKIIENSSLKHHKQETIATKKHVSRVSGKKPKQNQSKALLGLADAGRERR